MVGYVLAGGRSRRMGVDKARLPARVDGGWWPLAVGVRRVLMDAGLRAVIVRRGGPDGLPWLDPRDGEVEVTYEPDDAEPHPLWGVATALRAGEDAVVVSCDLPHLTVDCVQSLIAAAAPCVAWDGHRVQPLIGHYPAAWAERAACMASAGGSVRDFAGGARRVALDASAVLNANRPTDLECGPLGALSERLGFLSESGLAAVLEGERARLRQRGVLAVT